MTSNRFRIGLNLTDFIDFFNFSLLSFHESRKVAREWTNSQKKRSKLQNMIAPAIILSIILVECLDK